MILASCKLYQPNNLLGSCSTEPARTLVHYQPTHDISILKGGQIPACISSKRKLTGRTVSVRVKQQIVANAERNSAHKYNSCTAISRRGVKLTTHKASIQNWEKNYSKAAFTNCGITWGHRRGPQAFLSSVPSQPSSLSWPAGVNPAPF